MKPKTAFSTLSCPDWSFQDLIARGTEYGFDGVEIRLLERETDLLAHPAFQESQLATRQQELHDAGFQICGLSSSVSFDSPEASVRRHQVEVGRRYLDLARILGADFVRVFGDVLYPGSELAEAVPIEQVTADKRRRTIGQVAEGLQQLGEYADTLDLQVLIETHGDFASSPVMRETLEEVESTAVGILWDTHHPWRFFGESLPSTFERLRPWIRHTHWKDSVMRPTPISGPDSDNTVSHHDVSHQAHALMTGHRHADYVLFRGGEFPAQECMWLLKNSGYTDWHCYEWEKTWHPELENPEIALPLFPPKLHELWSTTEAPQQPDSRSDGAVTRLTKPANRSAHFR